VICDPARWGVLALAVHIAKKGVFKCNGVNTPGGVDKTLHRLMVVTMKLY